MDQIMIHIWIHIHIISIWIKIRLRVAKLRLRLRVHVAVRVRSKILGILRVWFLVEWLLLVIITSILLMLFGFLFLNIFIRRKKRFSVLVSPSWGIIYRPCIFCRDWFLLKSKLFILGSIKLNGNKRGRTFATLRGRRCSIIFYGNIFVFGTSIGLIFVECFFGSRGFGSRVSLAIFITTWQLALLKVLSIKY